MAEFNADTTVRHILTTYPQAFAVFESHGMCEGCKADPPPVPLNQFAGRHGVALPRLIEELNAATGAGDA